MLSRLDWPRIWPRVLFVAGFLAWSLAITWFVFWGVEYAIGARQQVGVYGWLFTLAFNALLTWISLRLGDTTREKIVYVLSMPVYALWAIGSLIIVLYVADFVGWELVSVPSIIIYGALSYLGNYLRDLDFTRNLTNRLKGT